jgi:hypothetical protein
LRLSGCGLTTRNQSSDRAPDAGPDAEPDAGPDADIDPLDPCVERPPITEPTENCAYPVAPLADPPRLESVESLQAPDCRQCRLGEAIELPPFEQETRYAFSFDEPVSHDQAAEVARTNFSQAWSSCCPALSAASRAW